MVGGAQAPPISCAQLLRLRALKFSPGPPCDRDIMGWNSAAVVSAARGGKTLTPQNGTERANPAWPVFASLARYPAAALPSDLIAGLTLAAIAIPEQMATAKLGGFAPQIGFFAFIAGSIGFALLGANRFLSCGADSTITPIFAGGLAALAASGTPDYQAHAIALALL